MRQLVFVLDGERIYLVSDLFENLAKDFTLQQAIYFLSSIRDKLYEKKDSYGLEIFIDGYNYSNSGNAYVLESIPGYRYEILGYLITTTSNQGIVRLVSEERGDLIACLYCWNNKTISNENVDYELNRGEGVIVEWENLSDKALMFVQLTFILR